VRGHNDAPAALEQGLTNAVVWDIMTAFLEQNVQDMGMVLKAVTMTEKDTQISTNSAKNRWAKAKGKGKPLIVKMRVFAVHIGFAEDMEVALEDEQLIMEILNNLCRKRAHEFIEADSPWLLALDIHLAPVKAIHPKPIAIVFGLNPATHGANASTCLEINRHMWVAYNAMLTGAQWTPSFLDWHKQFGAQTVWRQGAELSGHYTVPHLRRGHGTEDGVPPNTLNSRPQNPQVLLRRIRMCPWYVAGITSRHSGTKKCNY
jgi:hypothetical protein